MNKPDDDVSSPTLRESDLSARARIREAALDLFGRRGFDVSVRAIAQAAGVSPGLVVHHFGTKARLRDAVEQAVLGVFHRQFAAVPADLSGDAYSSAIADAFAAAIAPSPQLRRYLRRSLLEDTPAGLTILDELLAAVRRGLDRLEERGDLRRSPDPTWSPYEVLAVILGPVLLEPLIERSSGEQLYAPDAVQRRKQAHLDFLSHALLAGPPPGEAR